MGRMKDIYIDFLNAQEEDPQDSPPTREWLYAIEEWQEEQKRRKECHKPKKEEDNGN